MNENIYNAIDVIASPLTFVASTFITNLYFKKSICVILLAMTESFQESIGI